jgi:tetratricopeptide (TPR) repeat protein
MLGILVVLLVFAGTYAFAWYNAYSLSERFIRDADASYDKGDFLRALVGYQNFDQQTNKYINYGGYFSVEKIWNNRFSWPIPPDVQRARQRSSDIIASRLTTAQAEQYILENTGRPGAAYFGEIYLRLGELYEQQGDVRDARDVYESIPSLFPNRPDLIQQAQQDLDRLNKSG